MRYSRFCTVVVCFVVASIAGAREDHSKGESLPKISGEWTGTWGPFQPGQAQPADKTMEKRLDCSVVRKGAGWGATFEGECGRPYKYVIKMDGRQTGDAVLFKGTVDLGEKDGGVYDWIGRATDGEFVGFYTSAKYAGAFRLSRKK